MSERDRRPDDGEGAGGFLRRWSRRKAEARHAEPDPGTAEDARPGPGDEDEPAGGARAVAAAGDAGAAAPIDPRDLPDIDSLRCGSDFTVFMRPGVPEELRTLALRRLWRLDPSFSKLDGLVEYGEDYTIPKRPAGAIKTAYQVGRGFVNRIEETAPAAPEPPEPAPTPDVAEARPAPAADDAAAAQAAGQATNEPAPAGASPRDERRPAARDDRVEAPKPGRPRPLPRRS
ncbi:MAG TPA: DUF3306 domain-containing protein [Geminicoccaceae bacterium]